MWNKHKEAMSEDLLHKIRITQSNMDLQFTDDIFNESLLLIEEKCIQINNKRLNQLGLLPPKKRVGNESFFSRSQIYNVEKLKIYVNQQKQLLNTDQKYVFETIMNNCYNNVGGIYFLDAPGGTGEMNNLYISRMLIMLYIFLGKTFLLNLILAEIRMQKEIVIPVASSGIAATLLEGGRTAHSMFKIPLQINQIEEPTCNIDKTSDIANFLRKSKMIIWDECTMANKKGFEALNRTMQDLKGNNALFGGTLLLLSGDFRQTLPVVPRSTPADELNACLKTSFLWKSVKSMSLELNMRTHLQKNETSRNYAENLLKIGNGSILTDAESREILLPDNFCHYCDSVTSLIKKVYPDIKENYENYKWLSERALLAPTNEMVHKMNDQILLQIPGEIKIYTSVDSMIDENEVVNYPQEFLNSLEPSGMPQHILKLKIGSIIMMIRNLDPPYLCNGTRMIVTKLSKHLIEAKIIAGKYTGKSVLIPRIPMISTDLSFEFKRLQFPVRLAFAMTINKSQGQTLKTVGLNLEQPCFSHGQLYVACSRTGDPNQLFVYSPNKKTKNIVYPLALQ